MQLTIDNLTKRYAGGVQALTNVSLTLGSGLVGAAAVLLAPVGARVYGAWSVGLLLAFTSLTALSVVWSVRPHSSWQDAARMPAYITLKDVKKRWGHGQEDIFPVAQFEKLWGDMSALPEVECRYVSVPRLRGQQLKDQAQLDGWLRDGSAAYVEGLCAWE